MRRSAPKRSSRRRLIGKTVKSSPRSVPDWDQRCAGLRRGGSRRGTGLRRGDGDARAREAMKRIGVLALQGGFAAHARRLEELGHAAFEARTVRDVDNAEGLVLPGGE